MVIKLEEQGTAVIGMYENVEASKELVVSSLSKSKLSADFVPKPNNMYDINLQSIGDVRDV